MINNQDKGGRPKVPDELKSKTRCISVNDSRWNKFMKLGASKWLAMMIDKAKL